MTTKNDKIDLIIETMDLVNRSYFNILFEKYNCPQSSKHIKIADEGSLLNKEDIKAYPTAIASKELMKTIHVYNYHELDPCLDTKSEEVTLWIKKMHAGTGSSLTRDRFLQDIFKTEKKIKLGAKGTDLYIKLNNENISLAELQLLNLYYFVSDKESQFDIISQDIIGPETQDSMQKLWEKKSLIDSSKTYEQIFQEHPKLSTMPAKFQAQIPTINDKNQLTDERLAPGGHALFAVDALLAAYKKELRPSHLPKDKTLICAIANGEDLSGRPDKLMLGLMKEKNISIAMVTTTKTKNDLKGGQIALIKEDQNTIYTTIIEKAQAESAGQSQLFQEMGLRSNDNTAFFNTNMVLINYEVLTPLIEELIKDIGEKEFFKIISPDLILNKKSQQSADGIKQIYTQLEGAMGSTFLNLDKFWRKKYNRGLVSFINIDSKTRTYFFAPIKTAFDFYMQFHSDRFSLNLKNMKLLNNRPESLPSIILSNSYYNDLTNILNLFTNTSIIKLDKLNVKKGIVNLSNLSLHGNISIINESEEITDIFTQLKELQSEDNAQEKEFSIDEMNKLIIKDKSIYITKDKKLIIKHHETK